MEGNLYVTDSIDVPKRKAQTLNSNEGPLLQKWKFLAALTADPELTGEAKAVAFAILDHHNNDDGYARPGHTRIATRAGTSLSTVKRAIHRLRERGWFCVSPATDDKGDPDTNRYYPIWQRATSEAPASPERPRRKRRTASRVQATAPAGSPEPTFAFEAGPVRLTAEEVERVNAALGDYAEPFFGDVASKLAPESTVENWRERFEESLRSWEMPF